MGFKTRTLEDLCERNLNVFEFKEINTKENLVNYLDKNKCITVRFDSENHTEQLPFYILRDANENLINEIVDESKKLNCSMLCSNGINFDNVMICNFVYKLGYNDDFLLEISFDKTPLSKMYNQGTICVRGNIKDEFKDFCIFYNSDKQKQHLSKTVVEKLLCFMMEKDIRSRWCECSYYNVQVGILQEKFIFWQII